MNTIKKGFLMIGGMLGFMMVFPTTFLVIMDGVHLIQKVLRQMYPFLSFL